ncbi:hypothetical protein EVG20_g3615 [Dentipellis fragilis]|uniref:Uncharacterized protein n=1 Tax=Dentipellis fragilis TaxID=205917 RepID=A0A4Y9Z348_9AGAM|nr:hypothetical protein EVG20_g3615 [Dentipellis fragilis]
MSLTIAVLDADTMVESTSGARKSCLQSGSLDDWASRVQREGRVSHEYTLDRVVHMKSQVDMEHEYLLVHARSPSGNTIVLGVDRNASGDEPTASSRSLDVNLKPGCPNPHPDKQSAFDWVEVSPNGTTEHVTSKHGSSFILSTLTFPDTPNATPSPTLTHLSVLLQVVRREFPDYALLEHQCYWFARTIFLALLMLFHGVEEPHPENHMLQATLRGAHVSLYEASSTAIQNALQLPLFDFPILIVPASLFAVYSAVKLYGGHPVEDARSRSTICDEKIGKHRIPQKFRRAWREFVLSESSARPSDQTNPPFERLENDDYDHEQKPGSHQALPSLREVLYGASK